MIPEDVELVADLVPWNGPRYIVSWLRDSLTGHDASYASAVSVSGGTSSVEPGVPLGEVACCTTAVAGPQGRVGVITDRPNYSACIYKMVMRFVDDGT